MKKNMRNMIDISDPRVCMIGHPAPAWMVNYADLMTELVCFFIVLYALSASLNKGVSDAKKKVEEKMKEQQVQGEVKVTKEGMSITIEEKGQNVFFESGSAELSPRMEDILAAIGPTLKKLADDDHDIIVEGHTDDVPIHNAQFPSNWELSTARATSVVQSLIKEQHLAPGHMGAIGYGQYKSLVANDTEEHRSTNRRVVFFVKNQPPKAAPEDGKKEKPAAAAADSSASSLDSLTQSDPNAPPANGEPSTKEELPVPAQPSTENQ